MERDAQGTCLSRLTGQVPVLMPVIAKVIDHAFDSVQPVFPSFRTLLPEGVKQEGWYAILGNDTVAQPAIRIGPT